MVEYGYSADVVGVLKKAQTHSSDRRLVLRRAKRQIPTTTAAVRNSQNPLLSAQPNGYDMALFQTVANAEVPVATVLRLIPPPQVV